MRLRQCTTNSLRETLRVLCATEELLASPRRWTKAAWARDGAGEPAKPIAESARAWCLAGAVVRASHDLFGPARVWAELDHETNVPAVVHGSKRVVLSLRVLAFPIAFSVFSAGTSGAGTSRQEQPRARLVDLSVIAVWANDLPETDHDHVLGALGWAIGDVRAELGDRRRGHPEPRR